MRSTRRTTPHPAIGQLRRLAAWHRRRLTTQAEAGHGVALPIVYATRREPRRYTTGGA